MREWDADPTAAYTAVELLGWLDEPQVDDNEDYWRSIAEGRGGGSEGDRVLG